MARRALRRIASILATTCTAVAVLVLVVHAERRSHGHLPSPGAVALLLIAAALVALVQVWRRKGATSVVLAAAGAIMTWWAARAGHGIPNGFWSGLGTGLIVISVLPDTPDTRPRPTPKEAR